MSGGEFVLKRFVGVTNVILSLHLLIHCLCRIHSWKTYYLSTNTTFNNIFSGKSGGADAAAAGVTTPSAVPAGGNTSADVKTYYPCIPFICPCSIMCKVMGHGSGFQQGWNCNCIN